MKCGSFPSEVYDLFALGVLDEPESGEIRDHLRQSCLSCSDGMRDSLARVTEMALFVPAVAPPRHLRQRVVRSVTPARPGWRGWLAASPLGSPAFALAALALAVGLGAGWLAQERVKPAAAIVAQRSAPPVPTVQLPAPAVTPIPASAKLPNSDRALDEAERELARIRVSADATSRELADSRAIMTALQSDLRGKDQQIAETQQKLNQAQTHYAAATHDLETARANGAQLVDAQTRIEELSRQVALYKAAFNQEHRDRDHNQQLVSLLSAPDLKVVNLQSTERGGGSSARAILSRNGKAVFVATQLPALPGGRTYQLWLMRGSAPAIVSGGVFQPDPSKTAVVEVNDARLLAGVTGLAVTEEPAGGSPLPTGHKILVGLPRS